MTYCEGRILKIEELEAVQLDYQGGGDMDGKDKLLDNWGNKWQYNVSTSVL